jgi:hypothetical protein
MITHKVLYLIFKKQIFECKMNLIFKKLILLPKSIDCDIVKYTLALMLSFLNLIKWYF